MRVSPFRLAGGGLLLGVIAGGVLAEGTVPCPGSPGFPYQPPPFTIYATEHEYGIGRTDYNFAMSCISTVFHEDPCDPEFNADDFEIAGEEFTWKLDAPAGCLYTVAYNFSDHVWGNEAAHCRHDEDDDHAYAESMGKIRNDQAGYWQAVDNSAESTTTNRDEQDFDHTLYSAIAQKVCVGNGTLFSGSSAAEVVRTEVTASAHAYADAYYTDPMSIYTCPILCE
jgi:hypothetical protein